MSMRTPLKDRTVKVSFTLQEAVNLQNLLVLAMSSLEGGEARYSATRIKVREAVDAVINKFAEEEQP